VAPCALFVVVVLQGRCFCFPCPLPFSTALSTCTTHCVGCLCAGCGCGPRPAASCDLAKVHGYYETYPGSPVSKGILQPDMWGVTPSDRHDWAGLRARIAEHGVRNSLLLAPMPTASTAQVSLRVSLPPPHPHSLPLVALSEPVRGPHLSALIAGRALVCFGADSG
jgi:hypothetical protein